ncbi:hypothetical protein HPB48_001701 [Haemaphysalis longicornis]|uniref:Secreted protein n=1 Tax=Haemaphysalis longicornis TaxID=44386 RepID=A0A9J6GVA5_HAELO|nr:hypothetical protein HPB48_001701 [Haemaphysalis longicornis]
MHFCFFVQIALLRVDSVVGIAELFPPQGSIVAAAPDSPDNGAPSWKAAPQVLLPYHVVNSVTSVDTLELQHKTGSHLQQRFSGLGSTVFGRLLMHFCFFVQVLCMRLRKGSQGNVAYADEIDRQSQCMRERMRAKLQFLNFELEVVCGCHEGEVTVHNHYKEIDFRPLLDYCVPSLIVGFLIFPRSPLETIRQERFLGLNITYQLQPKELS